MTLQTADGQTDDESITSKSKTAELNSGSKVFGDKFNG